VNLKKNDLTLDDLVANPTDDFILDDWDDPEAEPVVWWARPITDQDRAALREASGEQNQP
jgi:hypothetical protein